MELTRSTQPDFHLGYAEGTLSPFLTPSKEVRLQGFTDDHTTSSLPLRVGVTQIQYMTTLLPSLSYDVSRSSHVVAACSHTGNVSQLAFDRLLCPHQQCTLSGASHRNMFHSSTQEKTLKFLASLGLG
ncbi:hypothetical protein D1007_22352 [Hordeum vulgare]|nr:hypothetical protein D1007_22352 [Hordeum vulgare]